MAISPPSDIVLDVVRAAEPSAVQAARVELSRRSGGASAAFSLEGTGPATRAAADGAKAETPASFVRFEAMVLQTFIQNMLPKDAETVYGKGIAGDMWKSMLAEQLAGVMAERGGIGIAERVLGDHYFEGENKVSVGAVSGGPEKAETDRQTMLSTALVQELQLRMARSLTGEEPTAANDTKI
ncbi:MAG: rod-binding protein [Pseudaminobacter sp.]